MELPVRLSAKEQTGQAKDGSSLPTKKKKKDKALNAGFIIATSFLHSTFFVV